MDLQKIKNTLPDVVDYNGREFRVIYYSRSIWKTKKFLTRSKGIIWEDKSGNQIYLFENNIDYIPMR